MWRFHSESHFVRESEEGIIEVFQYADGSWGWRANYALRIDKYWCEEGEELDSAAHAMAAAMSAADKRGNKVKNLD